MSAYDKILRLTNTLIQQNGFLGFSYAELEKEIGIREGSIRHHFPKKTDLGLAYCDYKTWVIGQLDSILSDIPPGLQRIKAYLDAFAGYAERGETCGVYAMLVDSHQFSPELQKAVSRLAQAEIQLLKDVLASGQKIGELRSDLSPDELAIIVCSALKGALLLNRCAPYDAYSETVDVLMVMLDART
ncbi:TPA: TetR/AcrR family transcriptional regulator [Escherichia coli]